MREFINAASKEKLMRSSKKAKEAHVLAWISIIMNLGIALYLILTQ